MANTGQKEEKHMKKKALSLVMALCLMLTLFGGSLGALPAAAENTDALFQSSPSAACFDQLWVGDMVTFDCMIHEVGMEPIAGNAITILSGDCVALVDASQATDEWTSLSCVKPGTAEIRVQSTDWQGYTGERTFTLTVSERPADRPVNVTRNCPDLLHFKLGDVGSKLKEAVIGKIQMENLSYGLAPVDVSGSGGLALTEGCSDLLWFGGGKGGYGAAFVADDRRCDRVGSWDTGMFEDSTFFRSGSFEMQPVYQGQTFGAPIKVIVDAPAVTHNAPAAVKPEDSIRLETTLVDTNVTNQPLSAYAEALEHDTDTNYWFSPAFGENWDEWIINYQPRIEVIEGQELVTVSDVENENTLSAAETLTFHGLGTVRLKITYHQINTCGMNLSYYDSDTGESVFRDNRYHPEQIVTIQVTENGEPVMLPGDIDGSGKVEVTDALAILRMAVGLTAPTANADLDGINGVTVADALTALRIAVGLS